VRSYLLLSLGMPPVPEGGETQELVGKARDHAVRLAREQPRLADLLCREFGLRQPPLSYLADRILAFWAEDEAWAVEPDRRLCYLESMLRPGVVNDDRERLRSWFVWLLALSGAPDAAEMEAWAQGVGATGGLRLRHEAALLGALGTGEAPEGPHGRPLADNALGAFAALATIADHRLHGAAPQALAYWADAALRVLGEAADQATAMGLLAEAGARMGQQAVSETYLAIAGALDEDVLPWARERVEVARLGGGVSRDCALDALRQWASVGTFREAWGNLLGPWREAADREGLLALTQFLRRVPDRWDGLLESLCSAARDAADATAIGQVLLETYRAGEDRIW